MQMYTHIYDIILMKNKYKQKEMWNLNFVFQYRLHVMNQHISRQAHEHVA